MPYQATDANNLTSTLLIYLPTVATLSIQQAAAACGVSGRTLRHWCATWPGLGHRTGQGWQIADRDLLAELVAVRGTGHLTARAVRDSVPTTRAAAKAPTDALTVAEAAVVLGATEGTVLRYCAAVPGFGRRAGGSGPWRIDPGTATTVAAIRMAAGGSMPIGSLVKETERRTALMQVVLTLMRQPEAVAQLRALIRQRVMPARARPKRTLPTGPARVQPVGEVRNEHQ